MIKADFIETMILKIFDFIMKVQKYQIFSGQSLIYIYKHVKTNKQTNILAPAMIRVSYTGSKYFSHPGSYNS